MLTCQCGIRAFRGGVVTWRICLPFTNQEVQPKVHLARSARMQEPVKPFLIEGEERRICSQLNGRGLQMSWNIAIRRCQNGESAGLVGA